MTDPLGPNTFAPAPLPSAAGPDADPRPWGLIVLGILLGLSAVRLAVVNLGAVELSGDEAQYWDWSRRLQWCYYSKPPGVAALVRLGTALFGHTQLGVRLPAIVMSLASSLVLYRLGTRLYDRKAGAWAALLLQIIPLFAVFGIGMTPDALLVLLWTLSLLLLHRAATDGRPADWLLLAATLGLGLLSKYVIALFYVPAAIYLLADPDRRRHLLTPWPYVCLVLSLAFFAPVLWWNSGHDWVMFRHDLSHGGVGKDLSLNPMSALEFVGGQIGIVTPVLAVGAVVLAVRARRRDPLAFWFSVPLLGLFVLKSLQSKVQPNWPLVAWIAALLPLGAWLAHRLAGAGKHLKRTMIVGLAIPIVLTTMVHVPFVLRDLPWHRTPLWHRSWIWKNPVGHPMKKLMGARQLGREVSRLRDAIDGPVFIVADYYQTTALLAFYVDGHPRTYYVNPGTRRANQYDLWPGFEDRIGDSAIFVTDNVIPPSLAEAFETTERHAIGITDAYGNTVRTYYAYECIGFKGYDARAPRGY